LKDLIELGALLRERCIELALIWVRARRAGR
jgi:hypothetical protein